MNIACPECGHAWMRYDGEQTEPEAGDLTICNGCGRVLRFLKRGFGAALRLAPLSERDERELRRRVRGLMRQR